MIVHSLPFACIYRFLLYSLGVFWAYFSSLSVFYFIDLCIFFQAYKRIGLHNEAAEAESQKENSELLGRLKFFGQNSSAGNLFDSIRDRLLFQGN